MDKLINIIIGIVVIAILVAGGLLGWSYLHPANDFVGSKLEVDLQQWQQAADDKPDDPLVRANLGAIYLDMGNTDKAIEELKTAIELEPKGYTYYEKLGEAYKKAGRPDDAIDILKQSLDLYPQEGKFLPAFEIAELYYDKGDLDASMDFVNQAITSDDTKWNFHYLKGQILEQKGDPSGAKAEYEWAAKFTQDPDLKAALARVS